MMSVTDVKRFCARPFCLGLKSAVYENARLAVKVILFQVACSNLVL